MVSEQQTLLVNIRPGKTGDDNPGYKADIQRLQDPNHLVRNPHLVTTSQHIGKYQIKTHLMKYSPSQIEKMVNAYTEHFESYNPDDKPGLAIMRHLNDRPHLLVIKGNTMNLPTPAGYGERSCINTNSPIHGALNGSTEDFSNQLKDLWAGQRAMTGLANDNYDSLHQVKDFKCANDDLKYKLSEHFMGYMNYICPNNIHITRMKDRHGNRTRNRFNVTFKNHEKGINKSFSNIDFKNLVTGVVDASKRGIIPLKQDVISKNFVAVAQATNTQSVVKPIKADILKKTNIQNLDTPELPDKEVNLDNGLDM